MRKRVRMVLGCALVVLLASVGAFAQEGHPSAKGTAMVSNLNVLSTESDGQLDSFETILSNSVKTSKKADLFVGVALECGVSTKVTARSKGGNKDTSIAEAGVEVQVLVDGVPMAPGSVTFCHQRTELSATLQGAIDGCSVDSETGVLIIDENCLLEEEIELIQSTTHAASFDFVAADVGTGVHNIEVQARIDLGSEADAGSAEGRALLGKGSATVEAVQMIKGEDFEL